MFTSREDTKQLGRRIEFMNSNDQYGAFHCDAPYGVRLHGVTWPTVTHYMLGRQYPAALAHGLRQSPTADEARRIAQAHSEPARNKWDVVKDDHLYRALAAKFNQHLDLEEMLVETGDIEIVYATPNDAHFGIGPNGKGHNMLGRLLMKVRRDLAGRFKSRVMSEQERLVIENLESGARHNPNNSEILTHLAVAYLNAGWLDRARSLARRLISMEPDSEYAHYVLALSLFREGRIEEAIAPLKRLTRFDPSFADYFRWLSDAYQRLDRRIPAALYARRARLLDGR